MKLGLAGIDEAGRATIKADLAAGRQGHLMSQAGSTARAQLSAALVQMAKVLAGSEDGFSASLAEGITINVPARRRACDWRTGGLPTTLPVQ